MPRDVCEPKGGGPVQAEAGAHVRIRWMWCPYLTSLGSRHLDLSATRGLRFAKDHLQVQRTSLGTRNERRPQNGPLLGRPIAGPA